MEEKTKPSDSTTRPILTNGGILPPSAPLGGSPILSHVPFLAPDATVVARDNPLVQSGRVSPTIGKLATALAKAQGEMHGAKKNAENPFFKSNYADLGSAIEAARNPLYKNELSVTQLPEILPDWKCVLRTVLMHASGEWISSVLPLNPSKPGPQEFGSYLSYMRRYAYMAILGMAAEDDDGALASGTTVGNPKPKQNRAPEVQKAALSTKATALMNAATSNEWKNSDVKELLITDFEVQKAEALSDDQLAKAMLTLRQNTPVQWRNLRGLPLS